MTKILHLNNFQNPLAPEHLWSIIPGEMEVKSTCGPVLQTSWSVQILLAGIEPIYARALTKYFGCEDWGEDQLRPFVVKRWSAPQLLTKNVKPKFSRRRTNWCRLIDFYNCSLDFFLFWSASSENLNHIFMVSSEKVVLNFMVTCYCLSLFSI